MGTALVPTSAAATSPCPAGEPCIVVHSAALPTGSAVVTVADINDGADLSTTTYQIRRPDGSTSSEGSTSRTLSIRALLALPALHWQGGDPIGQVTYTAAPHLNSATPSYLYHDDLLAPGSAGYPFGGGPPPGVWVSGATIQYARSPYGPSDVNVYDFWQTAVDGPLDLTVNTTGQAPLTPTLTADHTSVRSGGTVRFSVSLTRRPSGTLGYRWTFGDGATVDTTDPTTTVSHPYPAQGGSFAARVEVLQGGQVAGQSAAVTVTVGTPAPPTHAPTPHPGSGTSPPKHSLPVGPRHSHGHTGGASPSPTAGTGSVPTPASTPTPGAAPLPSTVPVPTAASTATSASSPSASPTPSAAPTRNPQPGSTAAALPVIQGELIASDTSGSAAAGAATRRAASAPPVQRRAIASRSVPWAVLAVALLLAAGAVGETGLPTRPVPRLGRLRPRLRRGRP